MSFAIDDEKITELLRSTGEGYTVAGSPLESPAIGNYAPFYGNTWAAGTLGVHSRNQLKDIRTKIVKSGKPLKGAAELTKEIEGMRGGNL